MPNRALIRRRKVQPPPGGLRLGLLAAVLSLLLVLLLAVGAVVLRLSAQLPDVGGIEAQFGLRGAEAFQPLLVFDRTGEAVLYRHLNPAAEFGRWVELSDLPGHVVDAVVAAHDPDYWTSPGYRALAVLDRSADTIAERLVRAALLPPMSSQWLRDLSTAVLAIELEGRYSKVRILEWYLNSADYGRAAYGIDAAALTYFAKPAQELELGEAALLAALTLDPGLDPSLQAGQALRQREQVLLAMPELSTARAQGTAEAPLLVRRETRTWDRPDYIAFLLSQLEQAVGREAIGRSGLRVISTIDQDLQDQSVCAAETHVARLSGAALETTVAARGEQPCVSAALLPTLRPGDAGVEHDVEVWGLVILDAGRGELLAAHGPVASPQPAGPITQPFLYLTAFSQGSAPASMVLDVGPEFEPAHGPVRMRIALANLHPGAAQQVLASVGAEALQRTLNQVGMAQGAEAGRTLLEASAAYGVLATQGLRIGYGQPAQPSVLLEVRQADGAVLYRYAPVEQAIVSPQLAHLMVDVLSDETARWPSLGQGNLLEVGFPAGVVTASSADARSNWTLGFTPARLVGVWLGGSPLHQVDRLNGAASIWHAVMRYASANLSARGWQPPPGMSTIEVCDPSGLLPTSYCPSVVRELFAPGTEPTHFDDLYRPVRINRETGKLATLFTPLELVEERVYFVPPHGAAEWAESVGLELPPEEYDPLSLDGPSWPGVSIRSPDPFQILADEVAILGEAAPPDFGYYRLQYGQGLNPARWVQIGTDRSRRVLDGRLGTWTTEGLNGLYTLQLLVILEDGQVRTAAVPVTIDNQPPQVALTDPPPNARYSLRQITSVALQGEVSDEVAVQRVEYLIDGRRAATLFAAPYRFEWTPNRTGVYELGIRAYDQAGNVAEGEPVVVTIAP